MRKSWKSAGKVLVAGALLFSVTIGGASHPATVSAAGAKAPTADQMLGKLTAASKTLKSFHLNATKKQTFQSGGMSLGNTNTLNLDINRLPSFAAAGTFEIGILEESFELYANSKEVYQVVDGSYLLEDEEDADATDDSGNAAAAEDTLVDGEPVDPDAQYWIPMEQEDWAAIYSKGQYDPASVLDSVKSYKKIMKTTVAGAQTVLQFTVTDAKAAKALITLYDRENLSEGAVVQPKSVTWKLYANSKTWQTEKLTVDLNYTQVEDGEKNGYTTKIEAKYSNHNKVAAIAKPAELE